MNQEKIIHVRLPCCNEFIDEQEVEFEDISEDIEGRDILKFICPKCNQSHESMRFG